MQVPLRAVSQSYCGHAGHEYVAARQDSVDNPGYPIDAAYFLPHLRSDDCVLDFGCGNGGVTRLIAPHVKSIDGLEPNPAAATMARRHVSRVIESLEELAPHSYDAIVSNHVLEHVRDVCGTLEALRVAMKPGARLIVKLPIDDYHASHQKSWSQQDPDHHLHTWTPRLFANTCFEAGLRVRDIRIITSAWHPRLFPLKKFGLDRLAFWALAYIKNRRQLFCVAENPA